jgi:hypothetical protein
MQQVSTSLIRLATLALATLLIATPAAAQQVDTTGEKELTAAGQKVDKASASADSKHVTDKIVDQWKGTQFKFDAADTTTRQLKAEDVQNLRQQKLGYGEISILLALAAKQDGTSPKSVNEILAMRQTDKMGWGNIAKALGYKSLGSVKQSVNATEAGIEKVSASGKAEKGSQVDKAEKAAKPDKPEKTEKFDKPERIRVEKPERVEKPGR